MFPIENICPTLFITNNCSVIKMKTINISTRASKLSSKTV